MKRLMLILHTLLLFILFPTFLWAANHYVRSGASGSNNGTDWTNAYTALPSSFVRGDTYYIGGGTYAGQTFSTAVSGATLIIIKGATIADHGTFAGWSDSYSVENAQAIFTSGLLFNSSYWVFDGSVGSMTKTPTAYGFSFGTGNGSLISTGSGPGSDITIAHVYAKATTNDQEKLFFQTPSGGGAQEWDNITISHCLIDGWQNGMMSRGVVNNPPANNNWIFENNMALNGSSTSANHGEWLNSNSAPLSNLIVRFSYFEGNSGGAGLTGVIVANNKDNNGAKVYGNIFNNVTVGNGIITGTSAGYLNNAEVYNNTFINCIVATQTPLNTPGSGNIAYNNIFYNMQAQINFATHDYNAFFSTLNDYPEAHKQTGSGSPFANISGGDFHLFAATQAGTMLSSPYNVDMDRKTRGADGTWDRGAYEFITGVIVKPMPPNLH